MNLKNKVGVVYRWAEAFSAPFLYSEVSNKLTFFVKIWKFWFSGESATLFHGLVNIHIAFDMAIYQTIGGRVWTDGVGRTDHRTGTRARNVCYTCLKIYYSICIIKNTGLFEIIRNRQDLFYILVHNITFQATGN